MGNLYRLTVGACQKDKPWNRQRQSNGSRWENKTFWAPTTSAAMNLRIATSRRASEQEAGELKSFAGWRVSGHEAL